MMDYWEPSLTQTLPGFLLTVGLLICGTYAYYTEEGWDWKLGCWLMFFIPGTIIGLTLLV
jgi:hypothetical protein